MFDIHCSSKADGTDDEPAANELFHLVYDDLRRLAKHYLKGERAGHTLQATALVHEAYLRLLRATSGNTQVGNRRVYFAAAARAMRYILVESARRRNSMKRGGDRSREALVSDQIAEPQIANDLLSLHEALDKLAETEPEIAELVTLRYFGGLSVRDAAEVLGISPRTVDSRWAYARAWLSVEMGSRI